MDKFKQYRAEKYFVERFEFGDNIDMHVNEVSVYLRGKFCDLTSFSPNYNICI